MFFLNIIICPFKTFQHKSLPQEEGDGVHARQFADQAGAAGAQVPAAGGQRHEEVSDRGGAAVLRRGAVQQEDPRRRQQNQRGATEEGAR